MPDVLSDTAENNVRIHGFLPWEGTRLFVKLFKAASTAEGVKALFFGRKAMREFRAGRYLAERGVPMPTILAVGVERRGSRAVLVFEEVTDAPSVHELLEETSIDLIPGLLEGLSDITVTLHDADFYHRDYHIGNLLAPSLGGVEDLLVIDLHRSSHPRSMSGRRGLENIADLLQSVTPGGDPSIIRRFLERYQERRRDLSWGLSEGQKYVTRRIAARERRRLKSRTKRCFKNSTDYFTARSSEWIFFGRREAFGDAGRDPRVALDEVTALIRRLDEGGGDVVKDDRKARVILLPGRDGEVCVKAYERLSLSECIRGLVKLSRGHRSWRAARGLGVRGFSVPGPIALLIRRRLFIPSAVYLVTESIGRYDARELDRFVLALREDREALVRCTSAVAGLLGSMHRTGVYHRDLKATNIALRASSGDDPPEALLLDLDAVTFGERVPTEAMAKNLAQLYLSTPLLIDGELRRLFFSEYRHMLGDDDGADRACGRLSELVRGEDILSVSPEGDVIETAASLYRELFEG